VRITIGIPSPQGGPISEVWTALGGELKPSLDVVVTAPFELGRTQPFGPPVSEEGPVISMVGRGAATGAAERAGQPLRAKPPPRRSRGRRR
jgi:Pvc16 N-terminal domain